MDEPFALYNTADDARSRSSSSTPPSPFPSPLLRPPQLPSLGSLSILSLSASRVDSLIADINSAEYQQSFTTLQHDSADVSSPVHQERHLRTWRRFTHLHLPPTPSSPPPAPPDDYLAEWQRELQAGLYDPTPLPSTSASALRLQLDLELSLLLAFFHTLAEPSYDHFALLVGAVSRAGGTSGYLEAVWDRYERLLPLHLPLVMLSAFCRAGDLTRAYLCLCRLRAVYGRVDRRAYDRLMGAMAAYGEWEWCERLWAEAVEGKGAIPQVAWHPVDPNLATLAHRDAAEEADWDEGEGEGEVEGRVMGDELLELRMRLHLTTACARAGRVAAMQSAFARFLAHPSSPALHSSLVLEAAVCAMVGALTQRGDRDARRDVRALLQQTAAMLPRPASGRALAAAILLPVAVRGHPLDAWVALLPSRALSVLTDVTCAVCLLAQAAVYREDVRAVEGDRWIGPLSHQPELRPFTSDAGSTQVGGEVRAEWEGRVERWYEWVRGRVHRARRGNAAFWQGHSSPTTSRHPPQRWVEDEGGDGRPRRRAISLSSGALRLQAMYHQLLWLLAPATSPSAAVLVRRLLRESESWSIPLYPTTWAALLSASPLVLHAAVQRRMQSSLQPLTPAVALALVQRAGRRPSLAAANRLWEWLVDRGVHRSRALYRAALAVGAASADGVGAVALVGRVVQAMREGGYGLEGEELQAVLAALVRARAWGEVRAVWEEARRYPQLYTAAVVSHLLYAAAVSGDAEFAGRLCGDVRGKETEEQRCMLALAMSRPRWEGLVPYLLQVVTRLPLERWKDSSLVFVVLQAARDRGEGAVQQRADAVWRKLQAGGEQGGGARDDEAVDDGLEDLLPWVEVCRLLLMQLDRARATVVKEEDRWHGWGVRLGVTREEEEGMAHQLRRLVEQSNHSRRARRGRRAVPIAAALAPPPSHPARGVVTPL